MYNKMFKFVSTCREHSVREHWSDILKKYKNINVYIHTVLDSTNNINNIL